eukprot:m.100970 g.100970  ORF g.100970 m.100970 type:complete len:278 (-) comp16785_c0_seq2:268-1101(-)
MSQTGDPFPAGSVCTYRDKYGNQLGEIQTVHGDGTYLVKFPEVEKAVNVERWNMQVPATSAVGSAEGDDIVQGANHNVSIQHMQYSRSSADDHIWADGVSVPGHLTEPVGLRYRDYGLTHSLAGKRDFWVAQKYARADAAERERRRQAQPESMIELYPDAAGVKYQSRTESAGDTNDTSDMLQLFLAEHALAQQRRKEEEEDMRRSEALALQLQVSEDQYRVQQSQHDAKLAHQITTNLIADQQRQTQQAKEQVVEDAYFAAGRRLTRRAKKHELNQ